MKQKVTDVIGGVTDTRGRRVDNVIVQIHFYGWINFKIVIIYMKSLHIVD